MWTPDSWKTHFLFLEVRVCALGWLSPYMNTHFMYLTCKTGIIQYSIQHPCPSFQKHTPMSTSLDEQNTEFSCPNTKQKMIHTADEKLDFTCRWVPQSLWNTEKYDCYWMTADQAAWSSSSRVWTEIEPTTSSAFQDAAKTERVLFFTVLRKINQWMRHRLMIRPSIEPG